MHIHVEIQSPSIFRYVTNIVYITHICDNITGTGHTGRYVSLLLNGYK